MGELEAGNVELQSEVDDAKRRISEIKDEVASLEKRYASLKKQETAPAEVERKKAEARPPEKAASLKGRVLLALRENQRYLLVPVAVNLARALIALSLFVAHSESGAFTTTYMDWRYAGGPLGEPFSVPIPKGHWSYLFFAWDSIWYIRIAWVGYEGTRFAFFPTLPLAIRLLYSFTMDWGLAVAIVSFVFGTIWMPFYQAVAEHYMDKERALLNTFLCAFFPFVFLFTSVAYTESIFLFACAAAWYYYLRGKLPHSFAMVAIAAVTRIYGLFMLIPILLDLFAKKDWKSMLYSFVPLFALFLWCYYNFISTGDWLAFRNLQVAYWGSPTWASQFIGRFLLGQPIDWSLYHNFMLGFIAVALYLSVVSLNVDWKLGAFAVIGVISNLFMGYLWSYTRHLTFFFPMWLTVKSSNKFVVGLACLLFLLCSIVLWNQFIMRQWVA